MNSKSKLLAPELVNAERPVWAFSKKIFCEGTKGKRRLKRQRSSSIYAPGTRKCIACGRTCVPASSPFAVRICAGDTWNRLAMPNNSSPACA